MPLTPERRWTTFLICVALLSLGIGAGVLVAHEGDNSLSDTEQRMIQSCITLTAILGGFATQAVMASKRESRRSEETVKVAEALAKKTDETVAKARADIRHDVRNELTPVSHYVLEIPDQVVKKINGGIEHEARKALADSALPSTPEQWNKSCDEIAEAAATRAVAKYIEKTKPGST